MDFGILNVLALLCGLALFLYGMDVMGDSLKKSAGNRLKTILGQLTSSPIKGFLLGLGVTSIIQSSSATTVMVVGFVNSGTMTLLQAAGVIIGANVGTAVTSWLTALSGAGDSSLAFLQYLKPDTWMPILAVIGICLTMFSKGKKKDIGAILLGFAVLMTGMEMMGDAVAPLKDNDAFKSILTMFDDNPILGVLAGTVLTAIVQSSSASVGILQSLTMTGVISYNAAIPIIMGQNIGTCVTAMLSALGANKNGKRAALVHLYFNVIGVVLVLGGYSILNAIVGFGLDQVMIDPWGVALVHTLFKIIVVALLFPFYKLLVKLAMLTIKDKPDEEESTSLLDDRLLDTPAVAVERAAQVTRDMADIAYKAINEAFLLMEEEYDPKRAALVRDLETKADGYEDALGSYLVKVSSCDIGGRDSREVTKLLHIIGDLERISDHAVNIAESVEELRDKKISFSDEAKRELGVLRGAVKEILTLTYESFMQNDLDRALDIEPLEQVVDDLRDMIKKGHIMRLQKSECTIEHGFVLSDLLTNLERIADHCSNIGGCVIEISAFDSFDMHKYLASVKHGSERYDSTYKRYSEQYSI